MILSTLFCAWPTTPTSEITAMAAGNSARTA